MGMGNTKRVYDTSYFAPTERGKLEGQLFYYYFAPTEQKFHKH